MKGRNLSAMRLFRLTRDSCAIGRIDLPWKRATRPGCLAGRCRLTVSHVASERSQIKASTPLSGYETLSKVTKHQSESKKSKFFAAAGPVQNLQEASEFLAAHGDPSASHNCFAWVIGPEVRSGDDGEPSGTAGSPILSAIQAEHLSHVCVLVTRYFGGTKLGTGGLVRAYGAVARECLRAAPKHFCPAMTALVLQAPFDCVGAVYSALEQHQAQREQEEFLESGHIKMQIQVPATSADDLISALADSTSGRATLQPAEPL